MKLSRAKIIFLTFLMAIIALWITAPSEKILKTPNQTQAPLQEYSWQTSNTTIWKITPDNTEKQTVIQAKQFDYNDDQKVSNYQKPSVTLIDGATTSQLTSESGQSINDNELIFQDNVNLTQTKLNAISRLQTERLVYNTQNQTMNSNENVSIEFKDTQITGTGFRVNLNTEEFLILSNVKSTIQRQGKE